MVYRVMHKVKKACVYVPPYCLCSKIITQIARCRRRRISTLCVTPRCFYRMPVISGCTCADPGGANAR